jgi:methyltransferase, FkbM family
MATFDVTLSTLDEEAKALPQIDLLWMDVQGAEAQVLRGAENTLGKTRSVFLEIALVQSPYKGAELFHGLEQTLTKFGFLCVGLGIDGWNGTGNALFVKDFGSLVLKPVEPAINSLS